MEGLLPPVGVAGLAPATRVSGVRAPMGGTRSKGIGKNGGRSMVRLGAQFSLPALLTSGLAAPDAHGVVPAVTVSA